MKVHTLRRAGLQEGMGSQAANHKGATGNRQQAGRHRQAQAGTGKHRQAEEQAGRHRRGRQCRQAVGFRQ